MDSDLAHDVRNGFFQLYDKGVPVPEIRKELAGLETELDDDLEREIFNSVLCQVLWEVSALEMDDIQRLNVIYQNESGLRSWKKVGAEAYEARKKVLKKQLAKLAQPKSTVRAPIPPPDPIFRVGDVVRYRGSNQEECHLLVVNTAHKGKTFLYALAPLRTKESVELTLESVASAEFVGHRVATSTPQFIYGFAVALLNHKILSKVRERFSRQFTVVIDLERARVGSFGGILTIQDFENEILRISTHLKSMELFKLGSVLKS